MIFNPADPKEVSRAIGSTAGLPLHIRRALTPGEDFSPIPVPHPGDWLSVHQEPEETFPQFAASNPRKPDSKRHRIYLTPLGEFPEGSGPSLDMLRDCAASHFMMDVVLKPALEPDRLRFTTRINPVTRNFQVLSLDVLVYLRQHMPSDAFCSLAITREDLYPEEVWNFVFGQASLKTGVGVFSFARYDPAFYGHVRRDGAGHLFNERCCKVLIHETAHLFSLGHCTFFHCIMNGSNHLAESDARPMHLCPVCLRKLHYCIGFDIMEYYQRIFHFSRTYDFKREAQWVNRRLEYILGV
ncbi:MAG: archaemetzincin [Desulfomonilia bacterium]|jgi:archaemetzincin